MKVAIFAAFLAATCDTCSAVDATVTVDWSSVLTRTYTAATIEVDVMPFLGRTEYGDLISFSAFCILKLYLRYYHKKHEADLPPILQGGPFNAYYEAMANLGAEYVRYAPWFANPRVVVPELTPSDCTKTKPATNWNSTYFDGIMRDFMAAVCGPDAVQGTCKLSVVQQLSTMPSYMYEGLCHHRSHIRRPRH